MRIYTYGDDRRPVIVLIHGMLTPYTIFQDHITRLSSQYFVIVPALDGHDGTDNDFISIEAQADALAAYLTETGHTALHAVCGLSLGGVIAFSLWQRSSLDIAHVVLDGAPLVGFGHLLKVGMTANYRTIVEKSKQRDPKTLENFRKHFLPARYLEDYLAFVDTMSDTSVCRLIDSVSRDRLANGLPDRNTALHYIHGTTVNEHTSKKTARRLRKLLGNNADIRCFHGDAHCYKAIYQPQQWLDTVETMWKRGYNVTAFL